MTHLINLVYASRADRSKYIKRLKKNTFTTVGQVYSYSGNCCRWVSCGFENIVTLVCLNLLGYNVFVAWS